MLEWYIPIETAIAMAWRQRAPGSKAGVRQLPNRSPRLHAKLLRWGKEELVEEEPTMLEGEVWKPLKWRCGVVPCDGLGYHVSDHGRLRNPKGLVTKGFAYGGRRWAAVRNAGLVDLHAAARLQPKSTPPPAIQLALDALLTNHTPRSLCDLNGISLATSWSYFSQAAPYAKPKKLATVWRALVDTDLLDALDIVRGDPRFGGALNDLMPLVMQHIPQSSAFRESECPMGELRFARLCMTSTDSLAPRTRVHTRHKSTGILSDP